MKTVSTLLLILLSVFSFAQSELAFEIPRKDLITEGIAYSKTTDHFYVGDLFQTKIVQINAKTGESSDFIDSDIYKARYIGIMVDDKRDHLWAVGNHIQDGVRTSSVVKFNVLTGELINYYTTKDTLIRTLNDIVIDKYGNAYISDSSNEHIFRIDNKTNKLTLFFESNEDLYRPNGMAVSEDLKYLYVNSTKGLRIIDIASRKIINTENELNSASMDGLKRYKNSLIGLKGDWTNFDNKVIRYYLSADGSKLESKEVIIKNSEYFGAATTVVVKGDEVYCLAETCLHNADWSNYSFRDPEKLGYVKIIKAPIEKEAKVAFEINNKNIVTEGIAYSRSTDHFYFGDIFNNKVIKIDAKTGKSSDFISSDIINQRFAGLFVDDKRDHIWGGGGITVDDKNTTAVSQFDVHTGELLASYFPIDTSFPSYFNDLVVDKAGNVYVTDSRNQHIFKIDQKTKKMSLFYAGEDTPNPNGIIISENQKYLYINCSNGIRILDIENKKVVNDEFEFDSDKMDGVKIYNNTLVGVKNFWPEHQKGILYQFKLNEEGTKIIDSKVLIKDHPIFALPTTCVLKDGIVYMIATSYLHNADWSDYTFKKPELKGNMIILKTKVLTEWE